MEAIYHELAAGKDSGLSLLLAAWNERCEKIYDSLRSGLCPYFADGEATVKRPNSAGCERPSLCDLREQFDEVLKLRATLTVEIDALQQLRIELEDSQSMSEVHIQLERASMENRRLQSSLRVAHEQISDLYFNKRVLEAEMAALRSDRDRQVAEAKERIRMAERAVVAATARGRFDTTVNPHPNNSHNAQTNNSSAPSNSDLRATDNPVQKLPFSTEKQPDHFTQSKRRVKDFSRFRHYTTLTGMTFDEFDSLDEDDPSDTEQLATELPCKLSPPLPVAHTNLSILDDIQTYESGGASISTVAETTGDITTTSDEHPFALSKPSFSTDELQTPISRIPNNKDELSTPNSSSTPRKMSDPRADPTAFSQTPLLNHAPTEPPTALLPSDTETVLKSDYIKLLDEIKDLRHQLDCVHSNCAPDDTHPIPLQAEVNATPGTHHTDSGFKDQLREANERLPKATSDGFLPPNVPGSTRIFDWSVSLNHSDAAILSDCEDDRSPEVSEPTVGAQMVLSSSHECDCCLQLQAKLLVTEVISEVVVEDVRQISNVQVVALQTEIERLKVTTSTEVQFANAKVQTSFPVDIVTSESNADFPTNQTHAANPSEYAALRSLAGLKFETDAGQLYSLLSALKQHSKFSADAANICLALAQRAPSLQHGTDFDCENEAKCANYFNALLNSLAPVHFENENSETDLYHFGYKVLAPALTQLSQEMEDLLNIITSPGFGRGFQNKDSIYLEGANELVNAHSLPSVESIFPLDGLPTEVQKLVTGTYQAIETERHQLQKEFERRISQFEHNHTCSLTELETSRRNLLEQLAASESNNVQLKDELAVLQQRLSAKDRFLAEQTEEREAERDEFRTELARLESRLKAAKSELLSSKLINGCPSHDLVESQNEPDSSWLSHSSEVQRMEINLFSPRRFPPNSARHQAANYESSLDPDDRSLSASDVAYHRSPYGGDISSWLNRSPNVLCDSWGNSQSVLGTHETSGVNLAVELLRALPLYVDKETETAELTLHYSPEFSGALTSTVSELIDQSVQVEVGDDVEELRQLLTEINELHEPALRDNCSSPIPFSLSDPAFASPKVDACTDTTDFSELSSDEELETVTTTKTTRTLDSKAAAAFMGQLTVVEESTTVTKSQPKAIRSKHPSKFTDIVTLVDEATSTDHLAMAATFASTSTQLFKRNLFSSSPCLNFEFTMSAVEDTGIDMSRGLSTFEGVEVTSTDGLHSPLTSSTGSSSTIQVGQVGPDSADCVVNAFEPTDQASTQVARSSDANHQILSKGRSTTTSKIPVCHELVSGETAASERNLLPGQNLKTPTTVTEKMDAFSSTEDLRFEFIPSAELAALLEGKSTSDMVISALRGEISSLGKYQNELQADYNLMQEMLDDRENELERCEQETLALQTRCDELERQIAERKNVVLERDEDLYVLTEENKTLRMKIDELEERLEVALPNLSFREVEVQTDLTRELNEEPLADSSSVTLETVHPVQVDTGRSDSIPDPIASAHAHEKLDLTGSQPMPKPHSVWTSTPADQSDASDNDSVVQGGSALPDELKVVLRRLREESLKILSLSSACQPTKSSVHPNVRDPEIATEPGAGDDESEACALSQPSVISDLVRANTALKVAFGQLAQVVDKYEDPPPNCGLQSSLFADNVQDLIKCFAKALSADESIWLTVLTRSVAHAASIFSVLPEVTQPHPSGGSGTVANRSVWAILDRLANEFISFIQQEDKYRNCLVQAHLVEQRCLTAELQAAMNRSNSLAADVTRMGERLTSHKESLARADSLNLRLANQVSNLKTELACATGDLEVERLESEKKQSEIVRLSNQLSEEQQRSAALATQTDSLKANTLLLEEALQKTTNTLMGTEKSFTQLKLRAESTERAIDDRNDQRTPWNVNSASLEALPRTYSSAKNSVNSVKINQIPSTLPNELYQVVTRTASHLAIARRNATVAERRARELQAANNALRLVLAETELRLMPLLLSTTRVCSSPEQLKNATCQQVAIERPISSSQYPSVTRFTELRGVCTHLLSIASAEEKESDQPSLTSDDNSSVSLSRENTPAAPRAVSFDPEISVVHSNSSTSASQIRNSVRMSAERDLDMLQTEALSRLISSAESEKSSHNSFQVSNGLLSPTVGQYPNRSSHPAPTLDGTVSLERFANIRTRYLRSESYRRALAFQKRYLILLLGQFQLPEEVVVASLGRPEPVHYDYNTGFPNPSISVPLRRFRTAVRTVQVIYRIRLMLGRWGRSDFNRGSKYCISSISTPASLDLRLTNDHLSIAQGDSRPSTRLPLRELSTKALNRRSPYTNTSSPPKGTSLTPSSHPGFSVKESLAPKHPISSTPLRTETHSRSPHKNHSRPPQNPLGGHAQAAIPTSTGLQPRSIAHSLYNHKLAHTRNSTPPTVSVNVGSPDKSCSNPSPSASHVSYHGGSIPSVCVNRSSAKASRWESSEEPSRAARRLMLTRTSTAHQNSSR